MEEDGKYEGLLHRRAREHRDLIRVALTTFPAVFGLRAYPGQRFRINEANSFVSDVDGVQLYLDREDDKGEWVPFTRDKPMAIAREFVNLKS